MVTASSAGCSAVALNGTKAGNSASGCSRKGPKDLKVNRRRLPNVLRQRDQHCMPFFDGRSIPLGVSL